MKKHHLFLLLTTLAIAACKRVDVLPTDSNEILPMATGNTWTYIDSMFVTTTATQPDTITRLITYTVAGPVSADYLSTTNGKREMHRIMGWELKTTLPYQPNTYVFILGDTVFTSGLYRYFYWFPENQECAKLHGFTSETPGTIMASNFYALQKSLVYPLSSADSIVSLPALRDHSGCLTTNLTSSPGKITFEVEFLPLHPQDAPVSVSTPAGTFLCKDYGSEWWMPGVGMVRSEHHGTAAFLDDNLVPQAGFLRWSRSLYSYHLE